MDRTYRQLTEDERVRLAPRARERYEAGSTLVEVAAEFGIGAGVARRLVQLAGGRIRSRRGSVDAAAEAELDRQADEVEAELRSWDARGGADAGV
ncbi:hypothetical protein [Jiangella alba]|uniref:Helix-turn-helix domain-containing protein n=1 Tax=Jiangella alba TaxID=561176 RepID=A0A1H5MRR1_9ACTN|nr:hypothetical protein [Jiangella alba]SEE91058.1 hypothetical protein SAMN04488561_3310 [Jiangella alba]